MELVDGRSKLDWARFFLSRKIEEREGERSVFPVSVAVIMSEQCLT
jgi:hypothetical protein